jgi:hypothetical protein
MNELPIYTTINLITVYQFNHFNGRHPLFCWNSKFSG